MKNLEFDKALDFIWRIVRESNKYIEETKPWKLMDDNKVKFEKVMSELIFNLNLIAKLLKPFMPQTSDKIKQQLKTGKREILFERVIK